LTVTVVHRITGGLTVTDVGQTITAGGLTIDAGGLTVTLVVHRQIGGAEILGGTDGHGCWAKPSPLVDYSLMLVGLTVTLGGASKNPGGAEILGGLGHGYYKTINAGGLTIDAGGLTVTLVVHKSV
jgi:hypothetical protein